MVNGNENIPVHISPSGESETPSINRLKNFPPQAVGKTVLLFEINNTLLLYPRECQRSYTDFR